MNVLALPLRLSNPEDRGVADAVIDDANGMPVAHCCHGGPDRYRHWREADAIIEACNLSAPVEFGARRQALKDAWDAVNALIHHGYLESSRQNEQRNGLVLASNAIMALMSEDPAP